MKFKGAVGPFCTETQIGKALSWASIYWQYIDPGSTSLLAERGARIPGYWPFTYVPLKRLRIQHKLIQTCG